MTTIFSSSNNFIIHYNTSFTTIAEAERVAEIFEDVKSLFCGTASGQYGFNTPISSNSLSGEVYPYYLIAIIDLSSNIGGMCDISNEANGYSIIYIDIDEADAVSSTELTTLISICAHEYFHAIMNIYGVGNDNGYQWFQECFASWAGVDYIGTTWHWPNAMSYFFLNTPGESLMSYSINERRYGSFLFALTISQEFGGVNTIKEIIESAASGTYYGNPYGAINSGLQSINQSYTIGSAFYSCALFNSWPEKFYGILFGATSYIWNQATATIINPTATPTSTSLEDLNSMSSNYYNFDTSLTGPYTLNLIIDMKITGLNSSYTTNIEDFEIGTIYVDSQNQVSSGNISVSSSRTIYQINNFNTTNIEEVRIIPINIDQSLMLKYQITYNL